MNQASIYLMTSSLCFVYCWTLVLKHFKNRSKIPQFQFFFSGFAGCIFQAISLKSLIIQPSGFNLSLTHCAALASWTMVLGLLLSSIKKPLKNMGIVLLPIHLIGSCLPLIWQFPYKIKPLPPGVVIHILTSIIAFSLLMIAAIQGLFLALQNKQLKTHRTSGLLRIFPPLETMESLLFEIIAAGTLTLSIAIITGFIFVDDLFAQHLAHKTVFTLIAWILFSSLLVARKFFALRGTKAIKTTITACCFLLLAFLGTKWVLEVLLS